MAPILSVLNQKGGSGKSTLALNIAVEFSQRGKRVLVIDTDEQGTTADWRSVREDDSISVIALQHAKSLKAEARRQAEFFDLVVIDGRPQVLDMTAAAIAAADAVLIPCQPSPPDIWGTRALVGMIHDRQEVTGGIPKAGFVVTLTEAGTILGREVDSQLAEMNLPVFAARLHRREVYKHSIGYGEAVVEFEPASIASSEVRQLVAEIIERGFLEGRG